MHRATGKLTSCEDDSAAWFDHLEESFSNREVHYKKFYPPVKACCHPAGTFMELLDYRYS